jgi:2-polyprenyl-6-methoxyphenol hydroxylase-like FAD-dependent oxidoreductase
MTLLIVGAGPTGLTLATQLQAFGTRFRIIDREADQVHESRALAIQPRTLEVLTGLGLADTLVERGNPAVRVELHTRARTAQIPLFDIGLDDTAYPFLLFLSQAETEAILNEHLARHDVTVARGVELTDLQQTPDHVTCTLRHADGPTETLQADYVIGCDGAHSAVRDRAGIDFTGSAYPQTFALADLDADSLDPEAVHVYLSPAGMLFFFPLDQPAPWRLLAMQPTQEHLPGTESPSLTELQALTDANTANTVQLHDPVWRTYFRLHHRHATTYRAGRVFLAGDAAHIHSPAGAQGMNTGIQDAWNLGWKLALITDGIANPELLHTYQTERQPVGRYVMRFTDRAFTIATSTNPPHPFHPHPYRTTPHRAHGPIPTRPRRRPAHPRPTHHQLPRQPRRPRRHTQTPPRPTRRRPPTRRPGQPRRHTPHPPPGPRRTPPPSPPHRPTRRLAPRPNRLPG